LDCEAYIGSVWNLENSGRLTARTGPGAYGKA
jgi:hypothetical protein